MQYIKSYKKSDAHLLYKENNGHQNGTDNRRYSCSHECQFIIFVHSIINPAFNVNINIVNDLLDKQKKTYNFKVN